MIYKPHFLLAAAASFFLIAMIRTAYICAYCLVKFLSFNTKRSDSFEYEQVALSIFLSNKSSPSGRKGSERSLSAFSSVVFTSTLFALNILKQIYSSEPGKSILLHFQGNWSRHFPYSRVTFRANFKGNTAALDEHRQALLRHYYFNWEKSATIL